VISDTDAASRGRSAGSIEIRPMAPGDMEAVCVVVGEAFSENPSTLANVRGDRNRASRVMRDGVRVAKFGRVWSTALVATHQGDISGVLNAAKWPNCQLGGLEKVKTAPAMVWIMRSTLPRALQMTRRRQAHDPAEPHWHVGPIGVRPDLQGLGIGSTLIRTFLEAADTEQAAVFLETDVDRNVTLYERFGFRMTSREDIVGVDTRFMWRAAATR